ncbi:hypothetical protein CSUI_008333 [Cystoisospora suis]|uniref:Uncharacterized protein n=1 Tax=Cystoisospora suis TaxID=483139 RepID=A0A2C6JP71_9APIC|nr:hypothetical protein CSUI_008333 [Cystoisospora suis]
MCLARYIHVCMYLYMYVRVHRRCMKTTSTIRR